MNNSWYKSVVFNGNQLGRTIGYPTANLDPNVLRKNLKEGVYSCYVDYQNKLYKGALYFGPRLVLNETKRVLEIYIINFNDNIYNKIIKFKLIKFIRGIKTFPSFEDLKKQLEEDIQIINNSKF
ncbi:MAG TPA: riboflavin kinase [Candidatus Nitrosocosmicus sp.]|nr:riboflavin kinase [Candidatus Nitrosocosmicus sp.]